MRRARTQQKWRRQSEQTMWLQPPFFWMREPQPGQALVLRESQDSSRLAACARATRSTPSHSRACACTMLITVFDPTLPYL